MFYKFSIGTILQPITLLYFRKLSLIGYQKLLRMWVIYNVVYDGSWDKK